MNLRTLALSTALSLVAAAGASAQSIIAISGAATDVTGSPPASVLSEAYESGFIRAFREKTVTLSSPLSLDYVVAGPQPVPALSTVTSFFFHFDGDELTSFNLAGTTVKFDRQIIGVIYGSSAVDATDPIFGLGGTAYPTFYTNRGLEAPDQLFTISGNTFTINAATFTNGAGELDQFRVILVPEPTTYAAAMGAVVLLIVGYRRFRESRQKTA